MRRLTMTLVALALLAGACGDDGGGGSEGSETSGSAYDTVTALNDDLAGAGIACDLEYEGLRDADREISQCVINDEQASLNIWFNDELRQAVIDQSGESVAFGANWTVEVATAQTAQQLAEALGGDTGTTESG